ncbi:hypothetical protein [Hoeflea sp.]|uniref:hypothetical protein n=1 Tax=Hoeflea sp. TaxID=1940281 RepID=UPI003A93A296
MNHPPRSDSHEPRKSLVSRASSLLTFLIVAGLAIVMSIPAIELMNRRERSHCTAYVKAPEGITLIAHAGGGLKQGDYSNSEEALDQSLAYGFRLFELDFNWTDDGNLAIGHDWKGEYRYWNNLGWANWIASFYTAPSSRRYEASTPRFGLTRLSLEALIYWLRNNPGRIVTDFKTGNLEGLALIASHAKELQHRFVPQIYAMSEYSAARELGYDDIILTTYRLSPGAEIFRQIDALDLFAVTVPAAVVADAAGIISNNRIFTHTINAPVTLPAVGYYTDCLIPAETPDGT